MSQLSKSDYRSFHLLNATQFFGALNDNIFKLLVVYLLINVKGASEANTILSLAGAIFVLPFLFFSSAAGVLADRLSKRTIIVITKVTEVIIMGLAFAAVYYRSEFSVYFLLFLMGTQSAAFGPSKYGIIPELIESKKVSKANGSITALTYLAIICGTFTASFVTDITNKNFKIVSLLCIFIAIAGFFTSIGINRTVPRNSTKKINPLFIYEIYRTLALSLKRPFLFPAILGAAFFLFIGAYLQLNIIPYAMQSLHLSEVGGGYLFLATAIGIAIGARIAGRLSRDRIEIGLACLSGFFIMFVFFLLSIFSSSLYIVVFLLIIIGVFGGMYLIPLESFIQVASPDKRRGQIIAASNFLSFACVLLAAFALYLFNEKLGLTAAKSFAAVGFLTFLFNSTVSARMSSFFFPYFAHKILLRFYEVEVETAFPANSYIAMRKWTLLDVFMLFFLCKSLKIVILGKPLEKFPWVTWLVNSISLLSPSTNHNTTLQRLFTKAKNLKTKDMHIAILVSPDYKEEMILEAYRKIIGKEEGPLHFVTNKRFKIPKSFFKRHSLVYSFRKQ